MPKWVILDNEGNVLEQVLSVEAPSDENGYNTKGKLIYQVEEFADDQVYAFDTVGGVWVPKLDVIKARAIQTLNQKREQAAIPYVTAGYAKTVTYAKQADEVARASLLAESLDIEQDFPFAYSQSIETGRNVEDILNSFAAGIAASTTALAQIEAKTQKALTTISDATTVEEIESALEVDW